MIPRAALATLLVWALGLIASGSVHGATIEGTLVNPDGADLTTAEVRLVLRSSETGELDSIDVSPDPAGKFVVGDLESPGMYFVTVTYRDIVFPPKMVQFDEGDPADARKVVEVPIPSIGTDVSGIRVSSLRMLLAKGEAGIYRVRTQLAITNTGDEVVMAGPDDAPAARVELLPFFEPKPPEALINRFVPATVDLENGNTLLLRGPVFPGQEQLLDLYYEVDAGGAALDTTLSFAEFVPNFELLIQDDGFAVDAQPLYPSQPTRTDEAAYVRYLGFDLTEQTKIPLRVSPLPPRRGVSPTVSAIAGTILFALVAFFVGLPVAQQAAGRTAPEFETASENEALFAALRDLEHDFEMGKISAGDRDRLREELRADALATMARARARAQSEEESRKQRDAEASPVNLFCSECGAEARVGANFCSRCGQRL